MGRPCGVRCLLPGLGRGPAGSPGPRTCKVRGAAPGSGSVLQGAVAAAPGGNRAPARERGRRAHPAHPAPAESPRRPPRPPTRTWSRLRRPRSPVDGTCRQRAPRRAARPVGPAQSEARPSRPAHWAPSPPVTPASPITVSRRPRPIGGKKCRPQERDPTLDSSPVGAGRLRGGGGVPSWGDSRALDYFPARPAQRTRRGGSGRYWTIARFGGLGQWSGEDMEVGGHQNIEAGYTWRIQIRGALGWE